MKRPLARPRCRRGSNIQVDGNEGLNGLRMENWCQAVPSCFRVAERLLAVVEGLSPMEWF